MPSELLLCPCGKPVERRSGAGRPPRTCLACREPYRDRRKVPGVGSEATYAPVNVKPPKPPKVDWRTLAGLPPAQPAAERVPYVPREVPRKAVVAERVKGSPRLKPISKKQA